MCGLAGFLAARDWDGDWQGALQAMTQSLAHRGPDDAGHWWDRRSGIALGHRRLAILDLSAQGHQPMFSPGRRSAIVFNGEIYNHKSLRAALEKTGNDCPVFRGHSDTEVLLHAIERWGVERALERSAGMFAFAHWDLESRVLTLARDRAGEKPLYYACDGRMLLFGSELKALRAHPMWSGRIHRGALGLFFALGYIPAPYSIFAGVLKVRPGMFMQVRERLGRLHIEEKCYWPVKTIYEQAPANRFADGEREAIGTLEQLLTESVRGQMVSDVPLGAFLSGGIDSSLVVSLMQACSSRPVKTFTIGSDAAAYNEAQRAQAVAKHLGTDHHEWIVTGADAMAVIPKMPVVFDEPFSDPSQIPTCLVSQLTRRHVTVSLSGDGGDELFGGYERYTETYRTWERQRRIPFIVRRLMASGFGMAGGLARGLGQAAGARTWEMLHTSIVRPLERRSEKYQMSSAEALYCHCSHLWPDFRELVLECEPSSSPFSALETERWADLGGFREWMMYRDFITYLPDDILVKVDRASMASSLESRAPFLDHRIVEFAARLPINLRIRDGQGKWILRQLLSKYLPQELVDRPKMGFLVPVGRWLRGPLRGWAEALLDETRMRQQGFLNPRPIRQKWEEHTSGRSTQWNNHLWSVLMFQAWLEQWGA